MADIISRLSGATKKLTPNEHGVVHIEGEIINDRRFDNGYSVLFVKTDKKEQVTLTGNMPQFLAGMCISANCEPFEHPKYGMQYKVLEIAEKGFGSKSALVDYLASPSFFGIGHILARRMVDQWGMDTLEILDNNPERLKEIEGIGKIKCDQFVENWHAQRAVHRLMTELMSYGMTMALAMKTYNHFREASLSVLQENPYRLIEIPGVGFLKADSIALQMGIDRKDPNRVKAAILHILDEALHSGGHCYLQTYTLDSKALELLNHDVNHFDVSTAIKELESNNHITVDDKERVYLTHIYMAEIEVVKKLKSMLKYQGMKLYDNIDALREKLKAIGVTEEISLAPEQEQAILNALNSRVSIITGGPGTGKTTITRAICQLLKSHNISFMLAAPTGRAAKRLNESTGEMAQTIHRLLCFVPGQGFAYNASNPLDTECVVVDESSMNDILLFRHLLAALEENVRLIIVGDADQLPSVGPGNVLRDMIASEVIPTVRLKHIFRQSKGSTIIDVAHQILRGEVPQLPAPAKAKGKNCMFVSAEPKETLIEYILALVGKHLPKIGINSSDIQILTPMRERGLGINDLNPRLQEMLNPPASDKAEINSDFKLYRVGDRVMQIRNDYDKGVFNGDLGTIAGINKEEAVIYVSYPDLEDLVVYKQSDWTDLQLAYASTVHKSQGSEYPVVIMVLHPSQRVLLQRNLFYTGLTRAKKLCIIIGTMGALETAIGNNKELKRNTTLASKLREYVGENNV